MEILCNTPKNSSCKKFDQSTTLMLYIKELNILYVTERLGKFMEN